MSKCHAELLYPPLHQVVLNSIQVAEQYTCTGLSEHWRRIEKLPYVNHELAGERFEGSAQSFKNKRMVTDFHTELPRNGCSVSRINCRREVVTFKLKP